jgi:hypothetical protein
MHDDKLTIHEMVEESRHFLWLMSGHFNQHGAFLSKAHSTRANQDLSVGSDLPQYAQTTNGNIPNSDPSIAQPIASPYTNCAIPAQSHIHNSLYKAILCQMWALNISTTSVHDETLQSFNHRIQLFLVYFLERWNKKLFTGTVLMLQTHIWKVLSLNLCHYKIYLDSAFLCFLSSSCYRPPSFFVIMCQLR